MSCDEVRQHLAEHVLGSLPEAVAEEVRSHLRGCTTCRRDRAALEEGIATLARAAHQVEPPEPLKDRVLGVLEEERTASSRLRRKAFPARRIALAAAAVILAGASAGVAAVQTQPAPH